MCVSGCVVLAYVYACVVQLVMEFLSLTDNLCFKQM